MTLPDFPGCFAAADEIDGIADAVREALAVHVGDESRELSEPSKVANWEDDERFRDG